MSTPDAIVTQLLRVHLGLNDDHGPNGASSSTNSIRSFRDLYQLPFLHSPQAKRELLRAAEATSCAGVIVDVLLFLSQTMAPALFTRELALTPVALSQWIHYMSEQCVVNNESVSLDALHGLLELYSVTKRFQDLATLLLGLVAKEKQIERALRVASEVAGIVRHYRHRFPNWLLELMTEHIALLELQIATEKSDAFTAPEVMCKAGYMDKRARGTTSIQANWRMRYFQLDATELAYSKHDAEKLAASKNPFLDKRQKGNMQLTKGLSVRPLEYNGKLSRRPYCIQIGDGDRALIIDPCTPVVQFEWMTALSANIKRLELDPVWLAFPRRCVHHMTMAEFLRYTLVYHGTGNNNRNSVTGGPQVLRERFQLDDRRYYYAMLQKLALVGDWREFEAQTRPTKSLNLSLFPTGGVNNSSSSTTIFDPSCIGFGAILDLALRGNAPLSLVADVEALYQKHESKNSSKPTWSCRTRGDDSASASLSIRIEVSDGIRAEG
ncbi:hypothetical protein Gpo141_00010855 [Globisporangium polare]